MRNATGKANAQYVTDLTMPQVLNMAKRNEQRDVAGDVEEMEQLIFHKVEQFDRLIPHLHPDEVQNLSLAIERDILQQNIDLGLPFGLYNTEKGIKIER